jgi:molybdopterin/thiamine biosynthesis adenylyltransferase
MSEITDAQLERYARHIILDEVGEEGQEKLLNAKVLCVGAGGLGAPMLMYLAAAGVGTIGIIDDDVVELSNLQRQIIHDTAQVGSPKVESAAASIKRINPEITLNCYAERLTASNATDLIGEYDLVADGSDNFDTRYLLNDACFLGQKTLVAAALLQFEGQLSTFKAWQGAPQPCYRCLFRDPPPPGMVPRCDEAGIFGAIAGVMGSLQATEVLKELLQLGDSLSGRLMIYDGLSTAFQMVNVSSDPGCPLCGETPSLTDLSHHSR